MTETIHAGQRLTGRALSGHVIVILRANDPLSWSWFSEHAFPRLMPGTTVEFRIEGEPATQCAGCGVTLSYTNRSARSGLTDCCWDCARTQPSTPVGCVILRD